MAQEIERKFLVTGDGWRRADRILEIRQGYLNAEPGRTVRIRTSGEQGWLTIKGMADGISRAEFEYEILLDEALEMLSTLCHQPVIEKRRHLLQIGPHTWEVDEFFGANEGLVVAEIELGGEDEPFEKPHWLGEEVSLDRRYSNSALAATPFSEWS